MKKSKKNPRFCWLFFRFSINYYRYEIVQIHQNIYLLENQRKNITDFPNVTKIRFIMAWSNKFETYRWFLGVYVENNINYVHVERPGVSSMCGGYWYQAFNFRTKSNHTLFDRAHFLSAHGAYYLFAPTEQSLPTFTKLWRLEIDQTFGEMKQIGANNSFTVTPPFLPVEVSAHKNRSRPNGVDSKLVYNHSFSSSVVVWRGSAQQINPLRKVLSSHPARTELIAN